jgi:NAD(P)-dependent dehydrogenase (short-subunit alcohol dehydrogenase family)
MSPPSAVQPRRVVVIGSQGVLGSVLVKAFASEAWRVLAGGRRPDDHPDFRHVDLDQPETVAAAIRDTDVAITVVPDRGITAERMVLDRGRTPSTSRPCPPGRASVSASRPTGPEGQWS